MDIRNLSAEELRELADKKDERSRLEESSKDHPYMVGAAYLIRTVTFTTVGVLTHVYDKELVLTDASWIPDTGRFSNMLKDGLEVQSESEVEPYESDVIVSRLSIVDVTRYGHNVPTKVK